MKNVRSLLLHVQSMQWAQAARDEALRLAEVNQYDVVISSGPPHESAEAARVVASRRAIPLVLDFRDPWSQRDTIHVELASFLQVKLAEYLERKSVQACRLLVMNTPRAVKAMRALYPSVDMIAVPNGFNGVRPAARHASNRFVAIYGGTIYLDRDPRPLFYALTRVAAELALTRDDFLLKFIGRELDFGGVPPAELARQCGVPDGLVESQGVLPQQALFEELASAALLVNLPQGERQCVPNKVYEYLHFPAWVLGLEPSGTATHDILYAAGADLAPPSDIDAIAELLRRRILAFRAGERPSPLAKPDEYSAASEANRFFSAVEERIFNGDDQRASSSLPLNNRDHVRH